MEQRLSSGARLLHGLLHLLQMWPRQPHMHKGMAMYCWLALHTEASLCAAGLLRDAVQESLP